MIDKAMILAAGLGTRMLPLTRHIPKPLIEINGRSLIDYKLEAARRVGVKTAVVNVHYLADKIEEHLAFCDNPQIILSDEREKLLDSGGGIQKALPHFADEPFFVLNSDVFWHGDKIPALSQLSKYWDGDKMDILMALAHREKAIGFYGAGDFFNDGDNRLTRRGENKTAPFAFAGDYIVHPRIFQNAPKEPFSANLLYDQAIAKGRLFGVPLEGLWLHVGTPQSIGEAQRAIALHSA
ncbi:MAG: nucleotidyltransferase family protein [Rhizobiaceae bacterium]|nr:nucleotidyltransferase family protein [Rhizobiaceae bacterium]